ncbi:ABC transporter ATP-binding protein [Ferruginivarius sediminum]|nr:ABC transporter ATP-binding protein [Ferruginivarius sediminum]
MLSVSGLCVFYGRAQVLFDLNAEVPRGRVVALMGRNGAGKSTTMKAIMGLLPVAAGRVAFEGREITGLDPYRIARLGIGYVPEDRRVFPDMTVDENLEVGRRPLPEGAGLDAPAWDREAIYTLFPNLRELRARGAGQTSGGEQQMLALARTLMGNPRLLLLDEPSEGLAPVIVQQMARAIQRLKRQGLTVLLSEQNLRFAHAVADEAVVIEKGRVRFAGSIQELEADETLKRAYLAV